MYKNIVFHNYTIINDLDSHNQTQSEKECRDTEVTHIIIKHASLLKFEIM